MNYQGIVYISNEIRFVLNTSRQVNLAAQNASLAARRAGNARGFQAVSTELKSFSQGLTDAMGDMAGDILALAQGVSGTYRDQRVYRQQQSALRLSDHAEVMVGAIARAECRRDDMLTVFRAHMRQIEQRLTRSLRLCSNGRALARSALIEATAGGISEGMLKNVAHDIECTIEDIYGRLKLIGARLHDEQESA